MASFPETAFVGESPYGVPWTKVHPSLLPPPLVTRLPRRWRLVVHHDHATGEVLALMHLTCNRLVDPLMWLLPRLLRLLADPPGRRLGLQVPGGQDGEARAKGSAQTTEAHQGAGIQRQRQLRRQGAGCPASHRKEVK